LLKVYGQAARFFFEYDRRFFYEILNKIHRLEPQYLPESPKSLRFLSRWFGYPRGEEISLLYRISKRKLSSLQISL
jgi:hypothetical protein